MVLKAPREFARAHSAGALDSHDLAIQGELHRARYQGGSDLLASAPNPGEDCSGCRATVLNIASRASQ